MTIGTDESAPTGCILGHRLTASQQRFLLSLPPTGGWKRTTPAELDEYGKNALRGFGSTGLVEGHYGTAEMRHRLTDEGRRVATRLRARTASSTREGL